MARIITDLHFDLLKYILILVAKSSDGAAYLAGAIPVSTGFMKVAEDTDVLKAVCFNNMSFSNLHGLFQQTNGLLYECAQVGNVTGEYFLAKMVLLSSSQLLATRREAQRIQSIHIGRLPTHKTCGGKIPREDALAATFMAHFIPGQACSTNVSGQSLLHWELVRTFLCHCSARDFTEMHEHLTCYIDYFTERGTHLNLRLHNSIDKMCSVGYHVRDSDDSDWKEIRGSPNGKIKILNEIEQTRQNNLGVALQKGSLNAPTVQLTKKQCLDANLLATCYFSACLEELGTNFRAVVTMYEECRTEALLSFGELFP